MQELLENIRARGLRYFGATKHIEGESTVLLRVAHHNSGLLRRTGGGSTYISLRDERIQVAESDIVLLDLDLYYSSARAVIGWNSMPRDARRVLQQWQPHPPNSPKDQRHECE